MNLWIITQDRQHLLSVNHIWLGTEQEGQMSIVSVDSGGYDITLGTYSVTRASFVLNTIFEEMALPTTRHTFKMPSR